MKEFYSKYKQPLTFLFFGTLTSILNLVIYWLFFKLIKCTNASSTIVAWLFAFVFSFICSKKFVFTTGLNAKDFKGTMKEFGSFFLARFILGVVDLIFMLIVVDFFHLDSTFMSLFMKLLSNCTLGVINYFISKKLIFTYSEKKEDIKYIGLIIIIGILSASFVFYKGLAVGDDFYYHTSLVYDLYKSALNNNFSLAINEYLISHIGYGARLYYPPLFEYTTVVIALTFKNYGMSLIMAIKTVILLEYIFSGIFMFYFLKKVFKNNKLLALIGAILYIVLPYRTTNDFNRTAYAEGLAMTFVPLVFSGLYEFLTFKKIRFKPFLVFSIGFALTFLSHTITATYLVLFGVIFALFYLRKLFNNLKIRRFRIYAYISVILILGLVSCYFVPLLKLTLEKQYIVCDLSLMATSKRYIPFRFDLLAKWGFLMFNDVWKGIDKFQILKCAIAILLIIIEVILQIFSKKYNKEKLILGINLVLNLIIISIYKANVVIISAVLVYYIVYAITYNKEIVKEDVDTNLFRSSLALTIVSLILLFVPYVYALLPKFMLNIQFTFRIFVFLYFSLSLLVPLLFKKYGLKQLSYIAFFCLISTAFTKANSKGYNFVYVLDDTIISDNTNGTGGWQKEYLPIEYAENSGYVCENENSLYYIIKNVFNINENAQDVVINPIIYNGSGAIQGENTYSVVLNETSTIQFGKIYYDGYKIKVTEDGTTYYVEPTKLDGLLSVTLDSGTYEIEVEYVGTKANNAARVVTGVSAVIVVLLSLSYLFKAENIIQEYEKGHKE